MLPASGTARLGISFSGADAGAGSVPKRNTRTYPVAVTLLALVVAATAHAQLTLRVRSRARIDAWAEREESAVRLAGLLQDDAGGPLADRSLRVQRRRDDGTRWAPPSRVVTDAQGRFALRIPAEPTRAEASVEFDGDPFHDPSATAVVIDPALPATRMTLHLPRGNVIDLDLAELSALISVHSSGATGARLVALTDERGHELATARTDAHGVAKLSVPTRALGPAGPGRLFARAAADATHAAALTELAVVRTRGTTLTLRARHDDSGAALVVSGALAAAGGPLTLRAVGVFADGAHLGTLLTDAAGAYSGELPLDARLARADLSVQARFDSDSPWLTSSRSEIQRLRAPARLADASLVWSLPAVAAMILAYRAARTPQLRASLPRQPPPRARGTTRQGEHVHARPPDLRVAALDECARVAEHTALRRDARTMTPSELAARHAEHAGHAARELALLVTLVEDAAFAANTPTPEDLARIREAADAAVASVTRGLQVDSDLGH